MIAFVSLFLGLLVGVQDVEVAVSLEVAKVELYLDGSPAAAADGKPWRIACDFGDVLRPHHLVAVAMDAGGEEVSRVEQWINLPRARAEVSLALESSSQGGSRTVRLIWQSMAAGRPLRSVVALDGVELEEVAADRYSLPSYDPSRLHVLSAELEFEGGLVSRVETALGGAAGDRVAVELTAVPLSADRGVSGLGIGDVQGRLRKAGVPLRVLAVERGGGDLVVVLDQEAVMSLGGHGLLLDANPAWLSSRDFDLADGEGVQFVAAVPRRVSEGSVPFDLFTVSEPFSASDGKLPYLLTHMNFRGSAEEQRIADAVAAAAVQATAGHGRRAVLLVQGPRPSDSSRYEVEEVRAYLESLRVPLVLWSTGPATSRTISEDRRALSAKTPWGRSRDVSSVSRLMDAAARLRRTLDSQVVVWVEGSHLPQAIELDDSIEGWEIAR